MFTMSGCFVTISRNKTFKQCCPLDTDFLFASVIFVCLASCKTESNSNLSFISDMHHSLIVTGQFHCGSHDLKDKCAITATFIGTLLSATGYLCDSCIMVRSFAARKKNNKYRVFVSVYLAAVNFLMPYLDQFPTIHLYLAG